MKKIIFSLLVMFFAFGLIGCAPIHPAAGGYPGVQVYGGVPPVVPVQGRVGSGVRPDIGYENHVRKMNGLRKAEDCAKKFPKFFRDHPGACTDAEQYASFQRCVAENQVARTQGKRVRHDCSIPRLNLWEIPY